MNDSLQKLSAVAESNGAALKSMVEIALDTSEAMFELNLSLARALAATGRESLAAGLSDPGTIEARANTQAIDLGTDYVRNLNDIFNRAQSEIARVHLEQMNDLSQSMRTLVDDLATEGPAGGADVLEQVQHAMAQVTEAYANLFQSARDLVASTTATEGTPPRKALSGTAPRRSTRKAA